MRWVEWDQRCVSTKQLRIKFVACMCVVLWKVEAFTTTLFGRHPRGNLKPKRRYFQRLHGVCISITRSGFQKSFRSRCSPVFHPSTCLRGRLFENAAPPKPKPYNPQRSDWLLVYSFWKRLLQPNGRKGIACARKSRSCHTRALRDHCAVLVRMPAFSKMFSGFNPHGYCSSSGVAW